MNQQMNQMNRTYKWDKITFKEKDVAFGHYSNQDVFKSDAVKVARWVVTKLGYPINQVQLYPVHVFTAFQGAIMKYSNLVNQYKIKNHLLDVYGKTFTSADNLDYTYASIKPSVQSVVEISKMYGRQALLRSTYDLQLYETLIETTPGKQDYTISDFIAKNGHKGKDIQLVTLYHTPHIYKSPYFNPLIYPGFNMANVMTQFGGAFATNVRFMIMPLFQTGLMMQAIQMDSTMRKSHLGFQLHKDKLRLYPTPRQETEILMEYILLQDKYGKSTNVPGEDQQTINNISNFPIRSHIKYDQINIPGKDWIFRYTYATCKQILGNIRSKFGGIPYTQGQLSLDGDTLRTQAQAQKDKLIQELKLILQESSVFNLAQKQSQISQHTLNILQKVPSPIIIR